jgi:hypothetical protein
MLYDFLLSKLPVELVDSIFSYSYSPQPTALLNDITDFHHTIEFIFTQYRNKYLYRVGLQNEGFEKHILLGDLCIFLHFTYTRQIQHRFYKSIPIKIFRKTNAVEKAIRLLWGIMTIDERRVAINYLSG